MLSTSITLFIFIFKRSTGYCSIVSVCLARTSRLLLQGSSNNRKPTQLCVYVGVCVCVGVVCFLNNYETWHRERKRCRCQVASGRHICRCSLHSLILHNLLPSVIWSNAKGHGIQLKAELELITLRFLLCSCRANVQVL